MRTHPNRSARAGFTLLEVAVSGLMLGLILGAAALVSSTGGQAARYADLQSRVQTKARRALDRVVEQLNAASQSQIAPDPGAVGTSTFSFRKVASVSNAGVVTFSNTFRLDLLDDDGEADDGVDNDGDLSIDEKQLVLTLDSGLASEKNITLAHDVRELMGTEIANGVDDDGDGLADEPGFLVTRSGSLLTLRLTIEQSLADRRVATTTLQTAVLLRN
ncbi:MAG: hypothetical protein HZA52_06530 [Planctomycetes bacterium]|nr:hypothetical protein [Planctomycetota bacterium]